MPASPKATHLKQQAIVTPDGRYIVVRGRLWRATNPALSDAERNTLTKQLMNARRVIKTAAKNSVELKTARQAVQAAKVGLGERGPVWWHDGAPDYNRHMAENTPYAPWFGALTGGKIKAKKPAKKLLKHATGSRV